jgi:DNA-binding CsgD family transcriptional regulator
MAKDASQILSLGMNLYDSYLQTKNPKADAIFKEINNHFDKASLENQMLVISYFLSQEDKHGFTFDQYKSLVTEKDKALKLKEVVKYEIISSLLEKIAKQKESNIEKTKAAVESNLTISKRNNSIILLISGIVLSLLIFLTTIWFLKRKNIETKNLLTQERNQHLSSQLELKKKNVQELAIDINMRRELSNKLIDKLENVDYSNESVVRNQVDSVKKEIKNFNLSTKSFEYINENIELISQDFFSSLELKHSGLTKYEKELCSYLKLGMNNKEISNLIHISPSSVRTSKSRLKKKLRINEDLYEYLKNI